MLKKIATAMIAAGALATGLTVPALADGTVAGHWQTMQLPTVGKGWSYVASVAAAGGVRWAVVNDNGEDAVWKNSGAGWSRTSLPLPSGYGQSDIIAGSATDVWAFNLDVDSIDYSGGFDALHWNGSSWSAAGKLDSPNLNGAGYISSAIVFGPANVWAFTDLGDTGAGIAWHWNGGNWSRVNAPKAGLSCGSALSASSIWACDGTSIAHWNGRSWTAASVASLLPSDNNFQKVNAVVAESPHNVYAVGDANGQDNSGALVILHWNGRNWSKVAGYAGGDASPGSVVSDGHGGLWLAVTNAPGVLLHWTGTQLTSVRPPLAAGPVGLDSLARTSAGPLLIGGHIHAAGEPAGNGTPVLFTYTP